MKTITVPDGFGGRTIELDCDDVLDTMPDGTRKLHVVGQPHLIRWVYSPETFMNTTHTPEELLKFAARARIDAAYDSEFSTFYLSRALEYETQAQKAIAKAQGQT